MPFCPSCNNELSEKDFIEVYIAPFNNKEYKLYHCPKCDLQWWEPLRIIPEFYEKEGDEVYAAFHVGVKRKVGKNHKMFFKHIPLKSGRLLDVGCGDGVFLLEAQERGYEVWGIDFDRKSICVCQERKGLKNTFAMSLQDFAEFCERKNLKFDVVTFFEVLEHQDKPKEFLQTVRSILKPDGWIAGSVPNRNGRTWKDIRKYTTTDHPPHHFLRLSSKALSNLFHIVGFHNHYVTTCARTIHEDAYWLSVKLLGLNFQKKVKHKLLGFRNQTYLYDEKDFFKAGVYKFIKSAGVLLLAIPILINRIVNFEASHYLYFQGRF